jgi:hypothetical protein
MYEVEFCDDSILMHGRQMRLLSAPGKKQGVAAKIKD